jgi:ribonuclease P protein component
MFLKKNRATKKDIQMLFEESSRSPQSLFRVFFGNYLTLRSSLLKNNLLLPKISFITPQNLKEKAVFRNLLRRRGYCVLEKYLQYFPSGFIGVFIFNKKGSDLFKSKNKKEANLILEEDVKNILKKAKLL